MTERTNRALVATTALAAAAGCIVTWKMYNDLQKMRKAKARRLNDHFNSIDVEDLGILARSGDYTLRDQAKQLLNDHMVSNDNISFLLEQCTVENQTQRMKAVGVLCSICKLQEFQYAFIKNNVFETLLKCLKIISNDFQVAKLAENCYLEYEIEETLKFCIVAIHGLVSESDLVLAEFFKTCKVVVGFLLELISEPSGNITVEIKRLCIAILQQMIQHEQMRCNLISYGIIHRTSLCFLQTISDPWMSKNCLQILVTHINLFENYVTEEFLQEMAQLGIIPVLVGCLKSDDADVVYWSTALLQEFLLKDLHRGVISKIPRLVRTLYNILVSSESSLQRLVLRIYCFLSINDDNFKKKLIKFTPLLKRLSVCLASGNSDLLYWSMLLVHDLAMTGRQAALKMIQANEELLKAIIALTQDTLEGPCDINLVAETLGFFCSCEPLHLKAIEYGCIRTVLGLLKSENTELQFWASSLLLNLAMSSDEARERIIKDGGIGLLLEMAVKESEMPQITAQASKVLVMLGFTDASLEVSLKAGTDSSIKIDGKEHSPVKYGINLVKIDILEYKVKKGRAFDLKNLIDAVSLLAELKNYKHNELVIITTQGNINELMNEVQGRNVASSLKDYGLRCDDLEKTGCWCIVAQSGRDGIRPIMVRQGETSLEFSVSIDLADQVNAFVQENLLEPLLNILVSAPAGSNISKVPELEILSTLARHEKHQTVMLSAAGLLDYIAELIWCFACMDTDQVAGKPLVVAHCVGAMKISHSLSTNPDQENRFCDSPVLGAIKSFLFTNCGVLLSTLKADVEYNEGANYCRALFSPGKDTFAESRQSMIGSESSSKNARYSAIFSDVGEFDADSARHLNLTIVPERRHGNNQRHSTCTSDVFDDGSEILSPFCADPKAHGEEIEALIAQVTFEKTFNKNEEEDTPAGGKCSTVNAGANNGNEKNQEHVQEGAFSGAAALDAREELNFVFQNDANEEVFRRNSNRDSRLSERSRGSRRSESELGRRYDEHENENFDFDDFEEEDLPLIPDNDDDDLGMSQSRGFFDVTRMASAQRMRSTSAFNPSDWPTTGTGCLSRTLSEAVLRAKSPLKDIASDLEDFEEASMNLTNYALMTAYFGLQRGQYKKHENRSDVGRFVHILWCILLGCKKENRIQWGMIISAIISKLCSKPLSKVHNKDKEHVGGVALDVDSMTVSMVISNDHLEVYNGNWTFESVTATTPVSARDAGIGIRSGWYYEVTLFSDGIMQIGWTSNRSLFEPEKGLGVGDNPKSVGFDGSRCRVCNGQRPNDDSQDCSYGKKWSMGDTVSCLLSVNGDASFWLNGQDLGIGLKDIDTTLCWFPAISLSLDQQCKANFGASSFLYEPPSGYHSVEQAASINTQALTSLSKGGISCDDLSLDDADSRFIQGAEAAEAQTDALQSPQPSSRRKADLQLRKSGLAFSPKDLLDSKGLEDLSEVLYFEVQCPANGERTSFDIGYQSTTRRVEVTCKIEGKRLYISTGDRGTHEIVAFDAIVGCGLIWPVKKVFFTIDGIEAHFASNLADENGVWEESLDEIIPYFSEECLEVNFGQRLFWSQVMNTLSFKKSCCQLLYDAVLKNELGT